MNTMPRATSGTSITVHERIGPFINQPSRSVPVFNTVTFGAMVGARQVDSELVVLTLGLGHQFG